jgi:hypothetical protein
MSTEPDDADALGRLLSDSRRLETPPSWATHRAEALWVSRPAETAPGPAWKRVVATLVRSIDPAPLALGLRGPGASVRQWLFHAEEHDIELRLRPDAVQPDCCWELSGQILGPQAQGMLQLLPVGAEATVWSQSLDPLGSFRFPGLNAGTWQLTVSLGDRRLELPALTWPSESAD